MTEESERPGTLRSKVGWDAIDEPCTNNTTPLARLGSPRYFSHRKSLTSPLLVQCSLPTTPDVDGRRDTDLVLRARSGFRTARFFLPPAGDFFFVLDLFDFVWGIIPSVGLV